MQDLGQSNLLTIEETAQLLKVSKDTVRRRIKAGEYEAEKIDGAYGEQWFLPKNQFDYAVETREVVSVNRAVSVAELQQGMQKAIADALTPIIAETTALKEQVSILESKIDKQEKALDNHFKLVDERLRTIADKEKQPKSFWVRLFK